MQCSLSWVGFHSSIVGGANLVHACDQQIVFSAPFRKYCVIAVREHKRDAVTLDTSGCCQGSNQIARNSTGSIVASELCFHLSIQTLALPCTTSLTTKSAQKLMFVPPRIWSVNSECTQAPRTEGVSSEWSDGQIFLPQSGCSHGPSVDQRVELPLRQFVDPRGLIRPECTH